MSKKSVRVSSLIPGYGVTGRALVGLSARGNVRGILAGKVLEGVFQALVPIYEQQWLPNLLCPIAKSTFWTEIINIQKLVPHVKHCLFGV